MLPAQPCLRLFQSTLPMWAATITLEFMITSTFYFNPRCPCGQRQRYVTGGINNGQFQSTLPVWAATVKISRGIKKIDISIHAARVGSDGAFVKIGVLEDVISIHAAHEGCDQTAGQQHRNPWHFNPRSP